MAGFEVGGKIIIQGMQETPEAGEIKETNSKCTIKSIRLNSNTEFCISHDFSIMYKDMY
jgi:hypothetical protein